MSVPNCTKSIPNKLKLISAIGSKKKNAFTFRESTSFNNKLWRPNFKGPKDSEYFKLENRYGVKPKAGPEISGAAQRDREAEIVWLELQRNSLITGQIFTPKATSDFHKLIQGDIQSTFEDYINNNQPKPAADYIAKCYAQIQRIFKFFHNHPASSSPDPAKQVSIAKIESYLWSKLDDIFAKTNIIERKLMENLGNGVRS